jgi:MFS family permease
MSGHGWVRAGLLAMAVDAVGVLPIFLTGAMAVQLRADIGLSLDSLGLVFASYFGAAALLSIPFRHASERIGLRASLRIGLTIYAAALLGMAVTASSTSAMCAFAGLAGIGTALTRTASSVLVTWHSEPERQGIAFGLKHSSIPVASLVAGLSVPALALTVGWRWAYGIAAALALIVAVLVPRSGGRLARGEKPGKPDLSRWQLTVVAMSFALGAAAAGSLGAYSVSTAVAAGLSEGAAGVLVALGSVVGLASRVGAGYWSDRRSGNQLDLVAGMMGIGVAGFLLLAVPHHVVVSIAVPIAFATGWAWLGSYNLAIAKLNPGAPGAAMGVVQAGAFMGSIAGPMFLGILAESHSHAAAWFGAAIASSLATVVVVALRRTLANAPAASTKQFDKHQVP